MERLKQIDFALFRLINIRLHSDWLEPVFWAISTSGLGWVQFVCCSFFLKSKRWRPLFFMSLFNFLVGLVSSLIKRYVPRDRPSKMLETFIAPDEHVFESSFPSGHTTTTFALATCIALLSIRNGRAWIGIPAFCWALLVGVSRIYRGLHWPTDVVAGALLGIAGGSIVFTLVMRKVDRSSVRAEEPQTAGDDDSHG